MSEPCIKPLNESLPARLCAGDALSWSVQTWLPAGTFVFLILTLLRKAPVTYQVGGSFAGSVFTPTVAVAVDGTAAFTLTSATTAAWTPGLYRWQAFSQDAQGDRDQLAVGELRIQPNPVTRTPADERTQDERTAEQVRALIAGKSLDDVNEYKIGGRELIKIPIPDLLKWLAVWEARVRNQRRRAGERVPSKTIQVSFGGRR